MARLRKDADISPIELELGAFLILNPQRYRDLEEKLARYTPHAPLLEELLDAFRKAIEVDGSPIFVDKHISRETHEKWMRLIQVYHIHTFAPDIVVKLRRYLDAEGRKQQLLAVFSALQQAVAQKGVTDEVKALMHQAQVLLLRDERALDLEQMLSFLRALTESERVRPQCHPFPYLQEALGFPVDIYHRDLTVVTGRTGRGKTTMSLNLARSYLDAGKVVCYVSTEMDERALAAKFCAIISKTPWRYIWGRQFNEELAKKAVQALEEYVRERKGEGGLFIYHAPACTVSDISYAATQCSSIYSRVDLLVVDYIQQVSSGVYKREETRAAELAAITREIADIAVSHNAAAVVVSQVNSLGEVKDSRAIAERAALVVRIGMWNYTHFEGYVKRMFGYDKNAIFPAEIKGALQEIFRHIMDVEVAKNRYGPLGEGKMGFLWWNPSTGVIERPLTISELNNKLSEVLGGKPPAAGIGKKQIHHEEKGFTELPSYSPDTLPPFGWDSTEEDLDFPF